MEPLPDAALGWLLAVTGCTALLDEQPLAGGWTSDMRRVRLRDRGRERDVVLRRIFREPWRSHAAALLTREAGVLTMLAGSEVPVASLIAVDPAGARAGAPALAMSLLPGGLVLGSDALHARLGELARVLVAIHRVRPAALPRPYESWAAPDRLAVPAWAGDPVAWRRAITVVAGGPPPHTPCFLHRDFHPGNVLFDGAAVSGVVDWVETSWGPADLDVAHCGTSLALLHGPHAADAFRAAYLARGGRLDPAPARRAYWELVDALGHLPDPGKMGRPWRDAGRADLTDAKVRVRLDEHVRRVIQRLG